MCTLVPQMDMFLHNTLMKGDSCYDKLDQDEFSIYVSDLMRARWKIYSIMESQLKLMVKIVV